MLSIPLLSACQKNLLPSLQPQELSVVGTVDPLLAIPHFLAMKLNYFEENQITVNDRWISPTDLADHWKQATTKPTLMLTDNQGANLLNSAAVLLAQLAKGDLVLVGRQQDNQFAWDHLQKQTVLISRQNHWNTHQSMVALQNQHLRPNFDYILLTNIPDQLVVNAFVYGTGNYLITNLPIALRLENQLQSQTITLIDKATGSTLGAGYLTSEQTITNHRETLQAYIDAIYKAQLWLKSHSNEEIAQQIAPYYRQYSVPELTELINRYRRMGILTDTPVIPDSLMATHREVVKLAAHNLQPWKVTINNSLAQQAMKRVKLEPPPPTK